MRYFIFDDSETYPIAILVKTSGFNKEAIRRYYVEPLLQKGIALGDIVAMTLKYNENNKAPKAFIDSYLEELLPALDSIGTQYLYCTDAAYFKVLTKQNRPNTRLGYVDPCVIKGFEHMKVIYGVSHTTIPYNPNNVTYLELANSTVADKYLGKYQEIGVDIIHHAAYPKTLEDIARALDSLHEHPVLAADIETFSLDFSQAGVGSITFCWSENHGISFLCDYSPLSEPDQNNNHGLFVPNEEVRALIKQFFIDYKGEIIWHRANYDLKVLIYTLWMDDLLDYEGLLEGLFTVFPDGRTHDTLIVGYLATNTTVSNPLSLKHLAQNFAGDWAQDEDDIKDIRKIPSKDLLLYNLIDGLATFYVMNTYYPKLVEDEQEEIYHSLMLPSQKVIIQTELTGMPLCADRVQEVKKTLLDIQTTAENELKGLHPDGSVNPAVREYIEQVELHIQTKAMEAINSKLKTKQHPLSKFSDLKFNPGSSQQLAYLLHNVMDLPVIERTPKKSPSTKADTIEKLINHTDNPHIRSFLSALIKYNEVSKILSTFIAAFERGLVKNDGRTYLHGNFNIGGTKSGRLSSSDPNLQNIPSNSVYGPLVKSCFIAPEGFLFTGADFNSLEDMISALTTKDPNKLKVYEEGFDGHSLRAVYYFSDELGHIDITDPEQVNKLKEMDHPLRQDSKAPTFLLTYGGTFHGLMRNLGWSEEKAKQVEASYHEMYSVSDQWVQDKLDEAAARGYVVVAFGLRLRTPLLARTIRGHATTPYIAAKEGRTAGNALGQSYGLLNNRALNEFMAKVWDSPYRLKVRPIAMIHDAIYLLIADDIEVIEWVNKELIKSMRWQELPEIQHPTVKLGAALDIFYPSWEKHLTLPNDASQEEIAELCQKYIESLSEPEE